uniref:Single-stranded DNA-binding protein n=1 Tax=Clastoptera arizonana TaxID=38151 RepID=A0A1B6DUF0_9HEMI
MLINKIFNSVKNSNKLSLISPIITRTLSDGAGKDNESFKIEKSINHVTLLGRVGSEPQKRGNEQHPVVLFSLATQTNFKYESGDYNQKTEWHRICVFKPGLRDIVYNYLRKGQRVHITGRLNYGEIKDEQGNQRQTTSIIAEDVIFFQSYE